MHTRCNAGKATSLLTAVASAALTLISPGIASATESSRTVTISSIHPVGTARPAGPASENIVRLYVNSAAWSGTSCRTDAADLSPDDWHLFAILMSGWRDGRTITLHVDDTLQLVAGDNVCRIVAAHVQ